MRLAAIDQTGISSARQLTVMNAYLDGKLPKTIAENASNAFAAEDLATSDHNATIPALQVTDTAFMGAEYFNTTTRQCDGNPDKSLPRDPLTNMYPYLACVGDGNVRMTHQRKAKYMFKNKRHMPKTCYKCHMALPGEDQEDDQEVV